MMLHCLKHALNSHFKSCIITRQFGVSSIQRSLYEPDYLVTMKPKYPSYDALTLKLTSYDFPVLENFQRYVHKYSEYLGIHVDNCWPLPPQQLKVQRYKPRSTKVDAEYKILIYQRYMKITIVAAFKLSLLLEILHTALPEGVKLTVIPFENEQEECRYVPNYELIENQKLLEELGGIPDDPDKY